MEFRLLGPVEALRDGRPVVLGGAKLRALLGLLLLHANEVVSRDRLIDALWPDRAPGTAAHSLDVQVSRLRKAFEPEALLLTRSGGYVLEIEREQIDVHRFERLLEGGRKANAAGNPSEALEALEGALALWRGRALSDLAYEPFAQEEIERLEELRLVALEERIDAELALARHDTAISELEALAAKHPHRERLRGQLMLALYRSGRQAEALRVYLETRKRLVEELGLEPGQRLRDLEQAILRQDPALDLRRRQLATRRGRALIAGLALVLAGGVTAAAVMLANGGTGSAQALVAPDSDVLLSTRTGKVVGDADVRDTAGVRFGAGSLWSVSLEGELTRIDPASGKVLATIGLGIVKPGGLAFGEGSVWVTDAYSPTLLRIDPALDEVVDRFSLPTNGLVTDLTGGVAVGASSVWVGHGAFNPGAWVERIDPKTGRVQHRFAILGGDADSLAFGDGALWVASNAAGEVRKIDPQTNEISFTKRLRPGSHPCCIAVGGGFAWAAGNPEASLWKFSRDGSLIDTVELPAPVKDVTYAAGALWAAIGERGLLLRIDPTTDARRPYVVGHQVTAVDAATGLVAAGVRPSTVDVTAGLKGDVVRVGLKSPQLFEIGGPALPSTDPALYAPWDKNLQQFDHATCAKLYDYPDVEGAAGRRVVTEVAAGFPTVSDGGRTYTIRIRDGFRFSPPSSAPVTAEAFRTAIEREISPKFSADPLDPRWKVLVGADAYNAGKSAHISGISTHRFTLVLHLTQAVPDLPRILALNVFCAVPPGTPVVPHGLEAPIPSAGPYYLAALTNSAAVLKRNPNYGGSRPQHLDAIVFELGVAPKDAAARVASGSLNYVLENDPAIAPETAAARAARSRFRLTPDSTGHVLAFTFNTERPLFADLRMRRAVQYALDRQALAQADPSGAAIPATRLLSPKVAGYSSAQLYPLRGELRIARGLARSRKAQAVVYTWNDAYSAALNRILRRALAAIGIAATFRTMTNDDYANNMVAAKASRSDLIWGGFNAETSDPVSYLQQGFLPANDRAELDRISKLSSPKRERRAAALARRIERQSLFAVYDIGAIPELVSNRLGCVVHQPEYPGVDLAALCSRRGRS
jgi:DNA-binding SARP family transcriptional activator/ABC-type oligopeptide transport system substrate-binding subunit/streptogramin lyase